MRQRRSDTGLDLGLCPYIPLSRSSPSSPPPPPHPSSSSSSDAISFATAPKSHNHHLHHYHVAILHDGRACVFDLTELQARAILMLARREAESRVARPPVSPKSRQDRSAYYMWRPRGISMKRSLMRFLQGRRSRSRRDRAQENSPYNNRIATSAANHHRTDNDNQN